MESNVGINDKKYLTKFNVFSFAVSGFGQNLIIGFVNSYILFFYTDIFVIGAGPAFVLMIVARIWDALNDPVMGTIVDKTRTKWGKMRPYLLFVSLPLAASTALLFLAPAGMSRTGMIVYAYITYIIWGMVYTVCDVPFWGLASVMTPNPKERISFISFSRLVHSIGGALPVLVLPMLVGFVGRDRGYTLAGIIIGILGGGLFILSFFGTKERAVKQEKAPTLKECFQYLKLNKPLQYVVIANVMGFMRAMPVVAGMYVATYLIKDIPLGISPEFFNTVIIGAWGVAGYLGMLLTPLICNKFNYRQIYYFSAVIGAAASVLLFIVGVNAYAILVCMLLCGFPYGLVCNINYAMIADSVDYVEWKTGKRTEGVTISFQTLMNKMMSALQVGLMALLLIVAKFAEPDKIDGTTIPKEQSGFTLGAIFFAITILPAIGWLLSIIPMRLYTFIGAERKRVHEELQRIRALKESQDLENGMPFADTELCAASPAEEAAADADRGAE